MDEVSRSSTKLKSWTKPLLVGGVGVVLVQIAYFVVVLLGFGEPKDPSAFGEMFGALNALFTGLGFMGAVYVIHRQVVDSAAARAEQEESFDLLRKQVASAQKAVELQTARDRVEAGPFFQLTSNSRSASGLDLVLTNVGAPVICLGFESVTKGCSVRDPWYPNTLPTGEKFTARCFIDNDAKVVEFRMKLRDRWGTEREFSIRLDQTSGTGRLDFWDVELPRDAVTC